MSEILNEFIDAMRGDGCGPENPAEIIADDVIRRYQVDGDRKGIKNGSYRLAEDDDFGYGFYMSFKMHSEAVKWHTKTKRKFTQEERDAHKRKTALARVERQKQLDHEHELARTEAAEMWADGTRTGSSPYLERKGITLTAVRYIGDTLLVPMYRDGGLTAVQKIMADGTKMFQKSSDHVGSYFSIRGDQGTIAICEGVATGGTIHMATGWSVICAFNAGNLKAVSKTIRDKYPDARLIIAADNDHETTNAKDEPWNPGIEKAQQAAVAIGGAQVMYPDCEHGESDWNDIHARLGLDAVKDALMAAPVVSIQHEEPEYDQWEPDYEPDEVVDAGDKSGNPMDVIRPLGHDRSRYFFFPVATGQVVEVSATSLSRAQTLYMLAPHEYWEAMYGTGEAEFKMSKISEQASAILMDACHRKGIYTPDKQRGVGVWRDGNGKLLVNCGAVIIGEGVKCHPSEYIGDHVYEAGPNVINLECEPLSNASAANFRNICKSLTWKLPQSGDLMAGWCVIASVGGCLDWRSHIFITGPKGSGKSTAMEDIVTRAVGSIGIKSDGGTTEAGLRKVIGASSRPFIMDEAEAESGPRQQQMKGILEYFRNASSGMVTNNAYATYIARSAACFGAINPPIDQGADADRWSMLELYVNTSPNSSQQFKDLVTNIDNVIDRDFSNKLIARTIANLDVLLDNIGVFADVFSKKLGSKRAGDQVGALMAGTYSLTNTNRVTYDFVEEWVNKQDWEWGELTGGTSDADSLMQYFMSARIDYDHEGMSRKGSIGEMIHRSIHDTGPAGETCALGLRGAGIRVIEDMILISNSSPRIKAALRDTAWSMNYKRVFRQYDGATGYDNKTVSFGPGMKTKVTAIPVAIAFGDDVSGADFDMEGFGE